MVRDLLYTGMNNKNYKRASGYAFRLVGELNRDLLHDAYIVWFNKTSNDLFEEDPRVITQVVKNVWRNKYVQSTSYMVNGEKVSLTFCDIDSYATDECTYAELYSNTKTTPEDIYIAKELNSNILAYKPKITKNNTISYRQKATKQHLEIYLYAVQGYTRTEIADMLGVTWPTVDNYFKRIKAYVAHFN